MSLIIDKSDILALVNELLPSNISDEKKKDIYERIVSSLSTNNENIDVLVDFETVVREILLELDN